MGWGSPVSSLWEKATDASKAAASKAAQTALSAYDYTKKKSEEAYLYSKEKAIQAYNFAEKKAVQGYEFAKDKAIKGYAFARDVGQKVADKVAAVGQVAGGMAADDAALISRNAKAAYNKARAAFGLSPAGSPTKNCPHAVDNKNFSDTDRDGWIMVPQGKDKPCIAIPPGNDSVASNNALKQARSQAMISSSDCCKKKRETEKSPRDIIFVNGIQNSSDLHCQTLNDIAKQTCARVVGVYNATSGRGILGLASDSIQTMTDRSLMERAKKNKPVPKQDGRNPAVDTLSRLIAKQVQEGSPPELWLHSQGGAAGSLALAEAKNALAPILGSRALDNVKVKSFGSAAPVWVDGPKSQHFVHVNDPVPTLLGVGVDPVEARRAGGAGSEIIHFSGDPKSPAPYKTADREREITKTSTDNHGMREAYLKMEKQRNGGCD